MDNTLIQIKPKIIYHNINDMNLIKKREGYIEKLDNIIELTNINICDIGENLDSSLYNSVICIVDKNIKYLLTCDFIFFIDISYMQNIEYDKTKIYLSNNFDSKLAVPSYNHVLESKLYIQCKNKNELAKLKLIL